MNCDPQIKALSRKLLLARHLVLAAREVTNRRNGGDDAEKEARNRTRYVSPLRRKKKNAENVLPAIVISNSSLGSEPVTVWQACWLTRRTDTLAGLLRNHIDVIQKL